MTFVQALRRAPVAALLSIGSMASAQPVQPLTALNSLQPGLWELKTRGAPPRTMCVTNMAAFLRLRHAHAECSTLVIANGPTSATVQYSCPGAGWGRTTVHAISSGSATIDTQGIADRAPFAFESDARRIGSCDARATSLGR